MRQDILLNDDGSDILIQGNDLVWGSSADQEVAQMVGSQKGEWVESPTAGFGIQSRIKKRVGSAPMIENPERFKRDLKVELEIDGFQDSEIIVTNDLNDLVINVQP